MERIWGQAAKPFQVLKVKELRQYVNLTCSLILIPDVKKGRGVRQEQGTEEAMILRSNLAQTILYDSAHPVSRLAHFQLVGDEGK